jgi:hypothetical protein
MTMVQDVVGMLIEHLGALRSYMVFMGRIEGGCASH